ncbi:MAG: RNA-processing protein [Methanoregulaceae archaeon]
MITMQTFWFGTLDGGKCRPVQGDAAAVAAYLASQKAAGIPVLPPDWSCAVSCGFCTDRDEYIRKLREITMLLAEDRLKSYYAEKDRELLSMVRMLDRMDEAINLLTEQVTEWYLVTDPRFSRKYRNLPAKPLLQIMKKKSRGALLGIIGNIEALSEERNDLMRQVSRAADRLLPNSSAILGGLVAARLLSRAGGLEALARLPASSIQVLGARGALFSHLRMKTPPPKHGIIFQHRRVHSAPTALRGKVARVIAGKLAIAVRLDYYRGQIDPEFIRKTDEHIGRLLEVKSDDMD